jgi:hypothetical protein
MKRFLVGAGWCLVFWMGAVMLGGMIVGAVAAAGSPDAETATRAGEVAGANFGARFGNAILLVSLGISTIGTLRGWLPGTRPKPVDALQA